jgi:EamA domain-containing membrane protein RarD
MKRRWDLDLLFNSDFYEWVRDLNEFPVINIKVIWSVIYPVTIKKSLTFVLVLNVARTQKKREKIREINRDFSLFGFKPLRNEFVDNLLFNSDFYEWVRDLNEFPVINIKVIWSVIYPVTVTTFYLGVFYCLHITKSLSNWLFQDS